MSQAYQELDVVVVGAGVIGLSIARAMAMQGREVMVLEKEVDVARHTSSRNSEVIHAGIYYPAGSLKAQLCVLGKVMLYQYCQDKQVPYKQCGKLIVATHADQPDSLLPIYERAKSAGVRDLIWQSDQELRSIYPELAAQRALYSPSTGIIDSHAYINALLADYEERGGLVVFDCAVHSIQPHSDGVAFRTGQEDEQFKAKTFINAAGLWAVDLAKPLLGRSSAADFVPYFAKGHYFSYASQTGFEHLIYPVPSEAGLGVHLTLDLSGRARFGPDVQWIDEPDDYDLATANKDKFVEAISRYWPSVNPEKLEPDYVGVRPKLTGPGEPAGDFTVLGPAEHGLAGVFHLLGIESPGLTSSLAIADYVAEKVKADA